jgi:hypothetical protein
MFMPVNPFKRRINAAYAPAQALEFKAAQSQHLTRTFASAFTDGDTGTFSILFKRSQIGANQELVWNRVGAANSFVIRLQSDDKLYIACDNTSGVLTSTQVFRDVTAFYHLVVKYAAGKPVVYLNGSQITSWAADSGSWPNADNHPWHSTTGGHEIGAYNYAGLINLFDGILADVCFVDGVALDPTYFGQFNTFNQWVPKRPTVTAWGTNGFYLDGEMSSTTVLDKSGNGNNWTAVNGVTTTSDVPGDKASADLGNYARLDVIGSWRGHATFSNAGRAVSLAYGDRNNYFPRVMTTMGIKGGKWYWEVGVSTTSGSSYYSGIKAVDEGFISGTAGLGDVNDPLTQTEYAYRSDGQKAHLGQSAYGGAWNTAGRVVGTALDLDAGTLEFFVDGVSQGVAFTGIDTSKTYSPCFDNTNATPSVLVANFDPVNWDYIPPTGFKPLCTAHLPVLPLVTPQTGTFTGNASADGPFVWLGYTPDTSVASTINGNAITWGTHAYPTAGGLKIITSSTSYNAAGANTYSIAVSNAFKMRAAQARAQ